MTRTGFDQPVPQDLRDDLLNNYVINRIGNPVEVGDISINPYPAGSMYTTAIDMTQLARMWLSNGSLGPVKILDQSSVDLAMQQQFTHHPSLEGWTYGFYEELEYKYRVVRHGGDLGGFASDFVIIPELELAYFFSQNAMNTGIRDLFLRELMHFLAPQSLDIPDVTPDFDERADYFTGEFWLTRYPHERADELPNYEPPLFFLSTNKETDELILTQVIQGQSFTVSLKEIEPYLFIFTNSEDKLYIQMNDDSSEIKYVFIGYLAFEPYENTNLSSSSFVSNSNPSPYSSDHTTLLLLLAVLPLFKNKRRILLTP